MVSVDPFIISKPLGFFIEIPTGGYRFANNSWSIDPAKLLLDDYDTLCISQVRDKF